MQTSFATALMEVLNLQSSEKVFREIVGRILKEIANYLQFQQDLMENTSKELYFLVKLQVSSIHIKCFRDKFRTPLNICDSTFSENK